ncbi:MAG: hypothetical protein ACRD10_01075, partial [Terriglobia bacterium]
MRSLKANLPGPIALAAVALTCSFVYGQARHERPGFQIQSRSNATLQLSSPLRSTASEPRDIAALMQQGNALSRAQHWREAIHIYEEVLAARPEDTAAHYNLATAYV